MMFEILIQPKELELDDLKKIIMSAFPKIEMSFLDDASVYHGANFVKITCNKTGYSVIIWENYDITLDSSVHPVTYTPILSIVGTLLNIGVIRKKINIIESIDDLPKYVKRKGKLY